MKTRALMCAGVGLFAVCAANGAVDFVAEVRPILAMHCHACHGVEKQKAGLRLDRREEALRGGDPGKVIVPGHAAESLLVKAVSGADPELVMPPEDEERLTAAQVDVLRRWVEAGAIWPEGVDGDGGRKVEHWAFRAPVAAEVPGPLAHARSHTEGAAKVNPVDAFVWARLRKEGIEPSPEADRVTLVRRLSFDLRGLPPTPEEVREFVADARPDAYGRLVERMLASPHFGERWGRHWLDLARYADSDGYEKDSPRPYAYLFRDWVIDAINRDVPFDQFTIEQLAGDLLPGATAAQKVATGFHRQTLTNKEGGVDKEEFRTKAVVDRVSTTGTVWLGLTVACAECHTHKFDPITQREFYQLYSFFNDASEAEIPMPQPSEVAEFARKMKAWEPKAQELEAALARRVAAVSPEALAAWEAQQVVPKAKWAVVRPDKVTIAVGDGETAITPARDGTVTTRLRDTTRGRWVVEATTNLKRVTGFRVEAVEEIGRAIGRGDGGDFGVAEFAVSVRGRAETAGDRVGAGESRRLEIGAARADFAAEGSEAEKAVDGNPETSWRVTGQTDRPHVIVFELKEPVEVSEGMTFVLEMDQSTVGVMNRFRVGVTGATGPLEPSALPDAVLAVLRVEPEKRSDAQRTELTRYFAENVNEEGRKLRVQLAAHSARKPAAPATTAAVLVAEERRTHVHVRGDFLRKGDEVQPGTLGVLHDFKPRGSRPDRLDLARWIVDPANPLTARVAVNHVWKNLFGRALVGTVDDFGTRGEMPSHPELLDWLAVAFAATRESAVGEDASEGRPYPALGWSRKALIRLIVSSATYRQASRARPELLQRDPNNLLLARQNRFRLEAEGVRDAFLAASGLLHPAIGGPSIRPQLPTDIAALGYANSVKWTESAGAEKYRRGMYIFFQRTVPYPMLMTFDAPDSNVTCARRERSNTPLQALTTLNDPVFFECAQALGRAAVNEMPDATAEARMRWVFARCLGREPGAAERAKLQEFYRGQLEMLRRTPGSAEKIAGGGEAKAVAETAAMVAVARIVMNLDEFLTRE